MGVIANSAVECFTKYIASHAGMSVGYAEADALDCIIQLPYLVFI